MLNRNKTIEEILVNFGTIKRKIFSGIGNFSDVTMAQGQVLRIVKQNEGVGVKEIARQLSISSSAAVQLIDSLVANGYLVRENNLSDRRAIRITLSELGLERLAQMRQSGLKKMSELFQSLDNEELEQFYKLSKKIVSKY